MNTLSRARSILIVAVKRLLAQRGLALATLLGLVAAVALTTSIPLYAEAVYYRVLSEGLFEETTRHQDAALRPPAVLLFRYVGSSTGPVQWESIQPLGTYFDHDLYRDLHLQPSPDARQVRMLNSGILGIFDSADAAVVTTKQPLFYMSLAAISDLEEHLTLAEGRYPGESSSAAEDGDSSDVEVLLSRAFADRMGVQAGETYLAYDLLAQSKYEADPTLFQLHVVGVWEPADEDEEFWGYTHVQPDSLLFVSLPSFAETISPALEDEIYQALWYLPLDASDIHVGDVVPLLERLHDLQERVARFLPNTILALSPEETLARYRESANRLTILLLAFGVPLITLVLAFVILVTTLIAERQRSQVAILRSRGATTSQVAGISALEGLLLGALAIAVSLPISLLLAYTIGQTRTFLDFSLASDLRVGLTWASVRYGVGAAVLSLIALIVPVLNNARHTIVTYKRERARTLRTPWWQVLARRSTADPGRIWDLYPAPAGKPAAGRCRHSRRSFSGSAALPGPGLERVRAGTFPAAPASLGDARPGLAGRPDAQRRAPPRRAPTLARFRLLRRALGLAGRHAKPVDVYRLACRHAEQPSVRPAAVPGRRRRQPGGRRGRSTVFSGGGLSTYGPKVVELCARH
jgi:putative ABC transport system permease protein